MEVKITFNGLNDLDKNHPYIKPYIYNDELIIRRIWSGPDLRDTDVPFEVFIPNRHITELNEEETWNRSAFENVSPSLIYLPIPVTDQPVPHVY